MLDDFDQSAKFWMADVLENFSGLLNEDEDPSLTLTIGEVEVEIRLNKAPGVFERKVLEIPPENFNKTRLNS